MEVLIITCSSLGFSVNGLCAAASPHSEEVPGGVSSLLWPPSTVQKHGRNVVRWVILVVIVEIIYIFF